MNFLKPSVKKILLTVFLTVVMGYFAFSIGLNSPVSNGGAPGGLNVYPSNLFWPWGFVSPVGFVNALETTLPYWLIVSYIISCLIFELVNKLAGKSYPKS